MTVAERDQFMFKIINRNQMRISCTITETDEKIISLARENISLVFWFECHAFKPKDQRKYRIVIRNLYHSTPIGAIVETIESTGNLVPEEIVNARYGPEKLAKSTFFTNLGESGIENPKKERLLYNTNDANNMSILKNITCEPPVRQATLDIKMHLTRS